MTTKTISVVITADGRQYAATIDKATGQLKQMGDEGERTGRKFKLLQADVFSLRNAVLGLGVGVAVREIIQAGLAADRMHNALTAATGSAAGATRELNFVREEAQRLGINFEEAAQGFTRMAAAARGTALEGQGAREVFTAVAEASRVMGLSAADTGGVLRAIEQIISKGTLSAEELRQQLGDRLPGAFQIAARAMGVTTEQLSKMVEQGEVLADDFLPRFGRELRKSVAGGVEGATESPAASFERLANAMFELKRSIAESGLIDGLADLAQFAGEGALAFRFWAEELGFLDRRIRNLSLGQVALEIQAVREELAQITSEAAAVQQGGMGFIGEPPMENSRVQALSKRLDALRRQEQELQKAEARARDLANRPKRSDAGGVPEAATKAGDSVFANLQRQLAIEREQHELAGLRFDLERGRLKDLAPARKQEILDAAQLVAAQRAHNEALKAARDEAAHRREDDLESLRAALRAEEEERKALERLEATKRTAAERSLDTLVRSLDSEVEAVRRRYDEGQEILVEALELQLITRQEFLQRGLDLERWQRESIADIHEREAKRMEREEKAAFRELSQAVKGWGRDFADTLLDNERNFSGFVDSLLHEIQRLAITKATDPLFSGLEKVFGDVAKGFDLGKIFGGGAAPATVPLGGGLAPALAMGGSFTVGGPPGIDRSLVAFRGTQGEKVTVTRPGQGSDGQAVRVELVNRGAPKEAQQGDVRFDARGMIVQVLLDDQRRGGPIISGLQSTLGLRRGG